MKRKLSVTHAGQTFTRTTERTYTHVVLVKSDYAHVYAGAIKGAADVARVNYPYYIKEANPATRQYKHSDAELARFAEIATMTIDQYAQYASDKAAERVDADLAAGAFDKFGPIGWCGRLDLARKQADQAKARGYGEVVIV